MYSKIAISAARRVRAQHPFHQLDLQLFHKPGVARQVLSALNALQKVIRKVLGEWQACFLSMKHGPDHSYTEHLTLSGWFAMPLAFRSINPAPHHAMTQHRPLNTRFGGWPMPRTMTTDASRAVPGHPVRARDTDTALAKPSRRHAANYAPRDGNDRLRLGLKGSLNEYELDLLRQHRRLVPRHRAARRMALSATNCGPSG